MEQIEFLILKNLLHNEKYLRKTIPFIKAEYFQDSNQKIVFEEVSSFVQEYNELPTKEILTIEVEKRNDINEESFKEVTHLIGCLDDSPVEFEWLVDTTEKWCRDRAIYLALLDSIAIADGKDEKKNPEAIPSILSDALAVSFDNHIGHDYLQDYEERFKFYHQKESRIQFDLDYFNKITKGGLPNKTLNIALAGTGVGKSLFMCHMAAASLMDGHNVLYITMEMAEERIAERIDANLLDVSMEELNIIPKTGYEKKMNRLKDRCTGKLVVKEYPTASANANHFRHLLQELRVKKNFKPDVIYIDYLNICASFRIRGGVNAGSYAIVKAIAEELRGLAVEFNVPIISATQTNRGGFANTDVGLEDTSESFGLPATADLMFALISTEELDEQKQILVKQLKNRYNDLVSNRKFVIGVDKSKMKLFDVSSEENNGLLGTGHDADMGTIEKEASKYSEKFTQWQI